MRIEEGKFYRTRDGRKVGPMVGGYFHEGRSFLSCDIRCSYWGDGVEYRTEESGNDLISEWTEGGPVVTETVTTRRIEPGAYGPLHVCVQDNHGYPVLLSFAGKLTGKPISSGVGFNAPELRELARVALEIAEYLDAQ